MPVGVQLVGGDREDLGVAPAAAEHADLVDVGGLRAEVAGERDRLDQRHLAVAVGAREGVDAGRAHLAEDEHPLHLLARDDHEVSVAQHHVLGEASAPDHGGEAHAEDRPVADDDRLLDVGVAREAADLRDGVEERGLAVHREQPRAGHLAEHEVALRAVVEHVDGDVGVPDLLRQRLGDRGLHLEHRAAGRVHRRQAREVDLPVLLDLRPGDLAAGRLAEAAELLALHVEHVADAHAVLLGLGAQLRGPFLRRERLEARRVLRRRGGEQAAKSMSVLTGVVTGTPRSRVRSSGMRADW
mgnify:CR=1 FL=1